MSGTGRPLGAKARKAQDKADAVRRYWHDTMKRYDVATWIDYCEETGEYEVRSNLVNGLPPYVPGMR